MSKPRDPRQAGRTRPRKEERAISAAIGKLDKRWKDSSHAIHPWEFGRRK
jgi:hypothetical protein